MKYNAIMIKQWIISQISPMGWSMVVSRSLPELTEVNPSFSASHITRRTKWSDQELDILQYYLRALFQVQIPEDVLVENGQFEHEFIELFSVNFFDHGRKSLFSMAKSILNILKF